MSISWLFFAYNETFTVNLMKSMLMSCFCVIQFTSNLHTEFFYSVSFCSWCFWDWDLCSVTVPDILPCPLLLSFFQAKLAKLFQTLRCWETIPLTIVTGIVRPALSLNLPFLGLTEQKAWWCFRAQRAPQEDFFKSSMLTLSWCWPFSLLEIPWPISCALPVTASDGVMVSSVHTYLP